MGGGIAMNFANAGIPVTMLEAKQEALDRGIAGIRKQYEGAVAKGKLKAEEAAKRAGLITPSLDYAAAAKADLVIEAVFEDLEVKKAVFRALDKVMKRGAILATNTSTLDVDAIAGVHEAARATCSACISSAPPTSCGCWKWCARRRPGPTCWPRPCRWRGASARPRWSPACATASSAIA